MCTDRQSRSTRGRTMGKTCHNLLYIYTFIFNQMNSIVSVNSTGVGATYQITKTTYQV